MTILLIVIIGFALIFDFINGFHDAANSIATIVSTKVLTPLQAVIWAAFFNFVAFFIFSDHGVANTISKVVHEDFITLHVVLAGLLASIAWNLLTWWYGIPSSSSHTLIGGFAGAAIAHAGFHAINPEPIIKTVAFIVLAPLIGMLIAYLISLWFIHSFSKSIYPKIVSVLIMAGVAFFIYAMFVTSTSRLMGITSMDGKDGQGVLIENLAHNSPAQKMGLKKGDLITEIDGFAVHTAASLDSVLRKHVYNSNISFVAERTGKDEAINTHFLTKYHSPAVDMMLYGENFKWLLLGLIVVCIGLFTFWLSALNYADSTKWFKRMQLVSSAAFSIGHGGNDAQKVMGIIAAALISAHVIDTFDQMPNWVPLACYTAISLGTMSGGWKIIKTMGTRITKVTPFEGVAAETAGAITLFVTEQLKIPVSTTHTITGSIIGVGATKRLSAVRWGVTINLMWAWILTIPVSALLAAGIYMLVRLLPI
ncbi:MAG: inorganic phosphate transporter [Chitinophagaceae bacterium]